LGVVTVVYNWRYIVLPVGECKQCRAEGANFYLLDGYVSDNQSQVADIALPEELK